MVAKLARLPLRARLGDIRAILVFGAILGAMALVAWAMIPTAQPAEHGEGKVVAYWSTPAGKTVPSRLMMDVELSDHRHATVPVPDGVAIQCKVGDRVRLTEAHTNGGLPWVTVEPGACR